MIKLKDYISRYEWNAYRYPTKYMRLKQDNWEKLYQRWNNSGDEADDHEVSGKTEEKKDSMFSKWKTFLAKKQADEIEENPKEAEALPDTEMELKHYFLNKLFPFQLKWASSTVTDVSFMAEKYRGDSLLMYFLQRFPDTYLVMYFPIFSIRKAPIEGDIILISPVGIDIIYVLEENTESPIMAGDDRTWTVGTGKMTSKILSPFIALKRTEQIVKSILRANEIEFPVTKTVLSRTNQLLFSTEPFNTTIIGMNEYENWFQKKRKLFSPLKNRQLKAAEILLNHCQTTAVKRPEWEEETDIFPIGNGE